MVALAGFAPRTALLLWLTGAVACSPPRVQEDKLCRTNAPPGDWNEYESEMTFASAKQGAEAVNRGLAAAQQTLLARLTGNKPADEVCGYAQLTSLVKPWQMCPDGSQVQLKAIANKADVAKWRAQYTAGGHATQLEAELKAMVDRAKAGKSWPSDAVVRVLTPDQGVDRGGSLADWLVSTAQSALAKTGVRVELDVAGASSATAQLGATVVRTADTVDTAYSVQWQLCLLGPARPGQTGRTAELCSGARTSLPVCLFPDGPGSGSQAAADSAELSLQLSGLSAGGTACEGARGRLELQVQRPLYVRIYNLYGADRGSVIYPLRSQPQLVQPGQPVVIDNLTVVYTGSQRERYVVLAADSEAALQGLPGSDALGVCQFDGPRAKALHDLRKPPKGLLWAQTGLFIQRGPQCPLAGAAAQAERDKNEAILKGYGSCR